MNTLDSTRHLLDPELYPLADAPDVPLHTDMLADYRAERAAAIVMADVDKLGVDRQEIFIPREGTDDLRCLLYTPNKIPRSGAGYLHLHGGGYVVGSPEGSDVMNALTVARLGIVILSVGYRLAPEHPIPAPLDDSYTGLRWLFDNAKALAIDPDRIGVGGESAGGGLAAALAIKARDAGEYSICHQHLTYPMLDNRTGTPEYLGDPLVGEFVWTRAKNRFGWESYLGTADPIAPQVPARVEDFGGLPPAWILTASLDLFRDENIDYARRLLAAGVSTELIVYSGVCHGFQQMMPNAKLTERYRTDHRNALARGLGIAI